MILFPVCMEELCNCLHILDSQFLLWISSVNSHESDIKFFLLCVNNLGCALRHLGYQVIDISHHISEYKDPQEFYHHRKHQLSVSVSIIVAITQCRKSSISPIQTCYVPFLKYKKKKCINYLAQEASTPFVPFKSSNLNPGSRVIVSFLFC